MSDFKLPEKWYVKVTKENKDVLAKWKFSNEGIVTPYDFKPGCIVGYCNNFNAKQWEEKVNDFWVNEITFEQFKIYVLKEEFKVGDYLYFMPEKTGYYVATVGTLAILKEFDRHEGEDAVIVDWINTPLQQNGLYYKKNFRKATQEEIDAVTKIEYTIEDLSNGKCAIINDGTVEELRLVLKAAFPNDESLLQGSQKFYCKSTVNKDSWTGIQGDKLPKQSVKTFLKQLNNNKQMEIIGYKLIKPEYKDAVFTICKLTNTSWLGFEHNNFRKDNAGCTGYEEYVKNLKEAGILDLWFEPVYKPEIKVFTMQCDGGTFELEVSNKGIYYKPESVFLCIETIEYLLKASQGEKLSVGTDKGRSYKVLFNKIDVGCKKNILISEWEQVYNYYKSLV